MIEVFIHLIIETYFIYLRQIRQVAYWPIVFFSFWKPESHLHFFNSKGKVASNIELLKLWKTNSGKISMLAWITAISLSWQAFLLIYLDYEFLLKSYFLFIFFIILLFNSIKINESRYIALFVVIHQKANAWVCDITGQKNFFIITNSFVVIVQDNRYFVKSLLEKREPIIFQNFLLPETTVSSSFPNLLVFRES